MSSIIASTLLPSLSFHGHGHRRAPQTSGNVQSAAGNSSSSPIGQLPVGVSSSLFSGLVQSFQQALGATSPASGVSAPTALQGSAAANQPASAALAGMTPGQQQELQAFQHSLFQALKQDGLSSNGTSNVVSSLNTLISQLGPGGKATAATTTLSATFQNLMSGVNGAGAVPASSSSSSSSALQNFLKNLLQNVQAGGVQSLASTGNSVNTHV